MTGIPRIARRTKTPTAVAMVPAAEIMAEPIDDFFDVDDDGEICVSTAPADIMAEPVDEIIDFDDDDDYPDPIVGGDAGSRRSRTTTMTIVRF